MPDEAHGENMNEEGLARHWRLLYNALITQGFDAPTTLEILKAWIVSCGTAPKKV